MASSGQKKLARLHVLIRNRHELHSIRFVVCGRTMNWITNLSELICWLVNQINLYRFLSHLKFKPLLSAKAVGSRKQGIKWLHLMLQFYSSLSKLGGKKGLNIGIMCLPEDTSPPPVCWPKFSLTSRKKQGILHPFLSGGCSFPWPKEKQKLGELFSPWAQQFWAPLQSLFKQAVQDSLELGWRGGFSMWAPLNGDAQERPGESASLWHSTACLNGWEPLKPCFLVPMKNCGEWKEGSKWLWTI